MTKKQDAALAYASWDAAWGLSAPWLNAADLGEVRRLAAGTEIYAQGQRHGYFYLLRSGFVHSTVQRSNGAEFLLEIFGPGAIFGEGPAFADRPRSATARAVTPLVVSRYTPAEAAAEFSARPEFASSLIRLLGFKNQMVVSKLMRVASPDPKERVIALLARIARLGAVNLTHEQIAAMTALSRVTVTRTLNALARDGIVETRARQVLILDEAALHQLNK
jgi:CRP-like cAMP-binding protein